MHDELWDGDTKYIRTYCLNCKVSAGVTPADTKIGISVCPNCWVRNYYDGAIEPYKFERLTQSEIDAIFGRTDSRSSEQSLPSAPAPASHPQQTQLQRPETGKPDRRKRTDLRTPVPA